MGTLDTLRYTKLPLTDGSGAMPALGFGTLIPDPLATKQAITTALEVGFRHFDCAERYRNEQAVVDAMQGMFRAGNIRREGVFVTTKLWSNNHRPERVRPGGSVTSGRTIEGPRPSAGSTLSSYFDRRRGRISTNRGIALWLYRSPLR